MRLHHVGLEEDKTFVFIAAHLAAQFKTMAATNCAQIEVNHEKLGLLTLTIRRQRPPISPNWLSQSVASMDKTG
jgi:hypothetical protein